MRINPNYPSINERHVNYEIKRHAVFNNGLCSFNLNSADFAQSQLRNLFHCLYGNDSTNKYRWYTRRVDQLANVYIEKVS